MGELELKTLVENIIKLKTDPDKIMEAEMLTPKLIRQLYKELGEPNTKDYPTVGKHIYSADRQAGFTKYIKVATAKDFEYMNGRVDMRINKMSETKAGIVDRYTRDDWSATVYAYNVICDTYVKHKDYDFIYIHFISTRDTSRYEYALVEGDN